VEDVAAFMDKFQIDSDDVKVQYTASFYFITTIITTIGFGDIVPYNTVERLFVIVIMYIGSVVFGILLAEVQQVVHQASQDAREKDSFIQTLMDFMQENDIPRETENEVIRWAQFDFDQKHTSKKQNDVLGNLPTPLRRKVLRFLHKDSLDSVPILADLSAIAGEDLILDLYASMHSVTFYPLSDICGSSRIADRLFVVASGVAKVEISSEHSVAKKAISWSQRRGSLQNVMSDSEQSRQEDPTAEDSDTDARRQESEAILLTIGDHFGENCLLGETDWSAGFPGYSVRISAMTALMCMVLTREKFQNVIAAYPYIVQEEVRHMSEQYMQKQKEEKSRAKTKHARIYFRWSKISKKLTKKYPDKSENVRGHTGVKNDLKKNVDKAYQDVF
jgi:CRP-like cAMP-binding protein